VSVAVTLGAATNADDASVLASVLGAATGLIIVAVVIYGCSRFASPLVRKLGSTGTVVLMRLSAFILLAIGVQILCDGIIEEFHIPIPQALSLRVASR
jgi:multiple antibiotic resistance protein